MSLPSLSDNPANEPGVIRYPAPAQISMQARSRDGNAISEKLIRTLFTFVPPALCSHANMTQVEDPVVPKTCKAGVVSNTGPNFTLAVEDVDVPEPGSHPCHDARN